MPPVWEPLNISSNSNLQSRARGSSFGGEPRGQQGRAGVQAAEEKEEEVEVEKEEEEVEEEEEGGVKGPVGETPRSSSSSPSPSLSSAQR